MVGAVGALAPFCAINTELEAFTVAFVAAGAFAGAAFAVLHCQLVLVQFKFFDEGLRIAFHYICFGGFDGLLFTSFVEAASATAFRMTEFAFSKALTVQF